MTCEFKGAPNMVIVTEMLLGSGQRQAIDKNSDVSKVVAMLKVLRDSFHEKVIVNASGVPKDVIEMRCRTCPEAEDMLPNEDE